MSLTRVTSSTKLALALRGGAPADILRTRGVPREVVDRLEVFKPTAEVYQALVPLTRALSRAGVPAQASGHLLVGLVRNSRTHLGPVSLALASRNHAQVEAAVATAQAIGLFTGLMPDRMVEGLRALLDLPPALLPTVREAGKALELDHAQFPSKALLISELIACADGSAALWAAIRPMLGSDLPREAVKPLFQHLGSMGAGELGTLARENARLSSLDLSPGLIRELSMLPLADRHATLSVSDALGIETLPASRWPRESLMRGVMSPKTHSAFAHLASLLEQHRVPRERRGPIAIGLQKVPPRQQRAALQLAEELGDFAGEAMHRMLEHEHPLGGFLRCFGALRQPGMATADLVKIFQALDRIPPAFQDELVQCCRPILLSGSAPERVASDIERASHRLVGTLTARAGFDPENVMNESRISLAAQSIKLLSEKLTLPSTATALDSLSAHLRALGQSALFDLEAQTLLRRRGSHGATELENALRTLEGQWVEGDLSPSLRSNEQFTAQDVTFGMGDLCAWVVAGIEQYRDQDPVKERQAKANMTHSLVLALAHCIEDDGHRVCGVGVSQRLLGVLQGYYDEVRIDPVTPGMLLCELGAELERLHGENPPSEALLREFWSWSNAQSGEHFAAGSAWAKQFRTDLIKYLDMTYKWSPVVLWANDPALNVVPPAAG
jgi:hypothetical protein